MGQEGGSVCEDFNIYLPPSIHFLDRNGKRHEVWKPSLLHSTKLISAKQSTPLFAAEETESHKFQQLFDL